jgi:PIN domain nuclease of toxin-antitoxin system
MKIIFDACAIIAFVKDEPGAAIVENYIVERSEDCLIHNVNLCEVYYNFDRSNGNAFAEAIVSDLQQAGITFCSDLTNEFWQKVGRYKATIVRILLADCFALTLANRENGVIVTSDRREFEPVADLNICPIEFIR